MRNFFKPNYSIQKLEDGREAVKGADGSRSEQKRGEVWDDEEVWWKILVLKKEKTEGTAQKDEK